jgi:hypothetical protein
MLLARQMLSMAGRAGPINSFHVGMQRTVKNNLNGMRVVFSGPEMASEIFQEPAPFILIWLRYTHPGLLGELSAVPLRDELDLRTGGGHQPKTENH